MLSFIMLGHQPDLTGLIKNFNLSNMNKMTHKWTDGQTESGNSNKFLNNDVNETLLEVEH